MLDRIFPRTPPAPLPMVSPPSHEQQIVSVTASQADILKRLVRIETRLCTLLEAMDVRIKPYGES